MNAKSAYINIKKIGDDLYVYNSEYQKLMPLINTNVNTFHYYLDVKKYQDQYIQFKTKATVVIFINNKLFKKFTNIDEIAIPILEMKKFLGNEQVCLLTIYSPQKTNQIIESIAISTLREAVQQSKSPYEIFERLNYLKSQAGIFIFVLVFILFFSLKRNLSPNFFNYVYDPKYLFGSEQDTDSFNLLRIDLSKIVFIIFDTLILAIVFNLMQSNKWDSSIYFSIMKTFMYLLVFMLFRYLFNQIVSNIFKTNNTTQVQYFLFVKYYLLFSFVLMLAYLSFCSPFTFFSISTIKIFNILMFGIFAIYMSKVIFTLKKILNFRSIYFISYICITELIPMALFLVYYFSRKNIGFV